MGRGVKQKGNNMLIQSNMLACEHFGLLLKNTPYIKAFRFLFPHEQLAPMFLLFSKPISPH